jgi:hypothetical protein
MIRLTLTVLILSALAGCGKTPAPLYALHESSEVSTPVEPDQFDPQAGGQIQGRVTWQGPRPDKKSFYYPTLFPGEMGLHQPLRNSLIPRISEKDGMGDVAVFLRGVDPGRAKPWDLPDVSVEIQKERMSVLQGAATDSRFGFVRAGQEVNMVSRDPAIQLVRGRDAAYFTITLAKPNDPRRQRFSKTGKVELSSASLFYWMRTWIYVSDHPYFTRTNEDGEFLLSDVPEGTYELVSVVPNWYVKHAERDPELMGYSRVWYRLPVEQVHQIQVKRGETAQVNFEVKLEDFDDRSDHRRSN